MTPTQQFFLLIAVCSLIMYLTFTWYSNQEEKRRKKDEEEARTMELLAKEYGPTRPAPRRFPIY